MHFTGKAGAMIKMAPAAGFARKFGYWRDPVPA